MKRFTINYEYDGYADTEVAGLVEDPEGEYCLYDEAVAELKPAPGPDNLERPALLQRQAG
jgi:hypothetical protein